MSIWNDNYDSYQPFAPDDPLGPTQPPVVPPDNGPMTGGPAGGPMAWMPGGFGGEPGGEPGGDGGPDFGGWTPPVYGGPTSPDYNFDTPPEFIPPEFLIPSLEQAMNEPGYRFRLQSGLEALQNSAAARGMTRSGGTWKDLINYGQNFATQEYAGVFNRALEAYRQKFQGAEAAFTPRFSSWQTLTAAEQARALAEFNRYYDAWLWNANAQTKQEEWFNQAAQGPPPQPPGQ